MDNFGTGADNVGTGMGGDMRTGLEGWHAAVQPDYIPPEVLATVRSHPGFPMALHQSVTGALALSDEGVGLHSALKDIGKFVLGIVALYLDATGGLSHRRLRTLSGGGGFASAGRATAVLLRLRSIGYVDRDRSTGSLRYVPNVRMRDAFRDRFRLELEAFRQVAPELAPVLLRFDEPAMFSGFMAEMGTLALGAAVRPMTSLAAFQAYTQRDSALLVLYALVLRAIAVANSPWPALSAS